MATVATPNFIHPTTIKILADCSYDGNYKLKPAGVKFQMEPWMVQEFLKCKDDPVYFCENYVKIINVDKGLMSFKPYPYQKEMINLLHTERNVIVKSCRQSGKTTTTVAYLIHYVIFNSEVRVAILANKEKTARGIVKRLQTAYENLPKWLQQGIATWNKGDIELENGSSVLSAATSQSGIRGESINILALDEFAHVPPNLASEFMESVYPTISSGQTTKVFMISTPKGIGNYFHKTWVNAEKKTNSYKTFTIDWRSVPGRDDVWKAKEIANTSERQFKQEYESAFLGSTNTLLEGDTLEQLSWKTPLEQTNLGFKIYEQPIKGHTYFMAIDVSEGLGLDYNALTVIDVTALPYKQVATFTNNYLTPPLFPAVIQAIAVKYNDALTLCEVNGPGDLVSRSLFNDLELENQMFTAVKGRSGVILTAGFGESSKIYYGIKTTIATKTVGCSLLKDLIENKQLEIVDAATVAQLSVFTQQGKTFRAEEGHFDDLVMSLVMFAWAQNQEYFKQIKNANLRELMYKAREQALMDDLMPIGFKVDGTTKEQDSFVEDGVRWHVVGNRR